MKVTLYHGTSDIIIDKIKEKGLKYPYLTNSIELAKYYADVACDELGGNIILLKVIIEDFNLEIDMNSLNEPVSFANYTISKLEELVENKLSKLKEKHPEWIENGYLNIPKNEYKISLSTVASCKCNSIISKKNIEIIN